MEKFGGVDFVVISAGCNPDFGRLTIDVRILLKMTIGFKLLTIKIIFPINIFFIFTIDCPFNLGQGHFVSAWCMQICK